MDCARGDWQPAEPLPPEQVAELPALLAAADGCLRPADVKQFAMLLADLFEWAELLEIGRFPADEAEKQRHVGRLTDLYAEDLRHLPADVLADALKEIRRRHRWAKMPTPADVLACAAGEMDRRRALKRRAETAMLMARRAAPAAPHNRPKDRYSPAEMARAAEWAERAKRIEPPPARRGADGPVRLGKRIGFTPAEMDEARDSLRGRPFVDRKPAAEPQPAEADGQGVPA